MPKPSLPVGTVLFVDDEPSVTKGITRALRKQPFEILTANSGQEALEILSSRTIDVVVSDECMPEMRGSELLARVRREHPETARLLLTGNATLEDASAAVNQAGISRFLMKPCPPAELAASVARVLEERDERQQFERWRLTLPGHNQAELQGILERALPRVHMVFQPLVHGAGQTLFGYEALARVGGDEVPGPEALFQVAQAAGRVTELEAHIHSLIASRAGELPHGAALLVNVHPTTIAEGGVLEASRALAPMADRIVLEVTEQSSYVDVPGLGDQVAALRRMGFRIALDDLGSGYASLIAFALLLPDIVKFDMELIHGIEECRTKGKLVQAMGGLCQELDILTVAEGVETEGQYRFAVQLGCNLVQGFHVGRPAPRFLEPWTSAAA